MIFPPCLFILGFQAFHPGHIIFPPWNRTSPNIFPQKDFIGQKLFWNSCFMVQVHSGTALSSDPDSISGQEMCSPNLQ